MDYAKEAIKQLVIDTMPTAAYHSGLAPKQDHTEWMAPIIAAHPQRPEQSGGGISALSRWLTDQCIGHTYQQAKALQDHYIREVFRSAKPGEIYMHCTPAKG
jgi:hypothetical protein